jgi:hypothetical protein
MASPSRDRVTVDLRGIGDAVRELMTPPDPPKRPIGFVTPDDKDSKGKAHGQR